ncbi:sugar transferase, partial [Burkholderia pseudomallei]
LINDMSLKNSLIVHRPVDESQLARYGDDVRYYHAAKPGMTGLWQVSGRNDTSYATRVSLDVSYVKEWPLRRDLVILLKTV